MKHPIATAEALRITVVSRASFLSGLHFTALFHASSAAMGGLWALIAGIVVLQADWPATWASARLRMLGTLIGAAVSAAYLSFLPFDAFGIVVCILATVLLCHAAGIPDPARLAAITVARVMAISNLDQAVLPITSALLRFTESLLGAAMALLAVRFWNAGPALAPPGDKR